MRPSLLDAVVLLSTASTVAADVLATVTPCPTGISWPTNIYVPPITVTSQYQPISTCVPTSHCSFGSCTTEYPFSTTLYLSTTIPCAFDGTSSSSTIVTRPTRPSHYQSGALHRPTGSRRQVLLGTIMPLQPGRHLPLCTPQLSKIITSNTVTLVRLAIPVMKEAAYAQN